MIPPSSPDPINAPATRFGCLIAGAHEERLKGLAEALSLTPVEPAQCAGFDFLLSANSANGALCIVSGADTSTPLLTSGTDGSELARRISAGKKQLFGRAIGLPRRANPNILDATGGLGRDALTLAGLGCPVSVIERHPLLYALLGETLSGSPFNHSITLHHGEAVPAIARAADSCDVLYLDPMYDSGDKQALPKKDQQTLRQLVGPDSDASELLRAGIQAGIHRIVVKRSPRAPCLDGLDPALNFRGNRVRYDVYLNPD